MNLFNVARLKSTTGHKKGDAPVGQSQLSALGADVGVREAVRLKACVKEVFWLGGVVGRGCNNLTLGKKVGREGESSFWRRLTRF